MEFVETRTFPSVYFGKCYSASVMKRLESKANFWEIIFDVDVDIYLHQNRRELPVYSEIRELQIHCCRNRRR